MSPEVHIKNPEFVSLGALSSPTDFALTGNIRPGNQYYHTYNAYLNLQEWRQPRLVEVKFYVRISFKILNVTFHINPFMVSFQPTHGQQMEGHNLHIRYSRYDMKFLNTLFSTHILQEMLYSVSHSF